MGKSGKAFQKALVRWMGAEGALFTPTRADALHRAVRRGKREIRADVRRGIVPRGTRSFADLHNHFDAHEYGGLCELWYEGAPDDDAFLKFCNDVQGALDRFVRSGRQDR